MTVLEQNIAEGGQGNWATLTGGVPVPPYRPRLSDDSIVVLVDYILSLDQ